MIKNPEENTVSNSTFVRGRDVFERMNYLYHLAYLWSGSHPHLAAYYSRLLVSVSKKSVLRLDSGIKSSICKGCSTILIPGKTSETKYSSQHKGQTLQICNICGVPKRIPVLKKTKRKN